MVRANHPPPSASSAVPSPSGASRHCPGAKGCVAPNPPRADGASVYGHHGENVGKWWLISARFPWIFRQTHVSAWFVENMVESWKPGSFGGSMVACKLSHKSIRWMRTRKPAHIWKIPAELRIQSSGEFTVDFPYACMKMLNVANPMP